jgi:hypothetical protein
MSLAEAPAEAGHNNPPTPYEEIKTTIEDLYLEATNFVDGDPIANEGQAKAVSDLIDKLRKAKTEADKRRVTEKTPFDDKAKEVQARYNLLIGTTKSTGKGKAILALEACAAALKPWLDAKEAERLEAVRIAREAEEKAEREKQEALAKRRDSLEKAEEAERAILHAAAAAATAKSVEKKRTNISGGGRAVGIQKTYTPVMVDGVAAARHYWETDRETVEAFFLSLAEKDVRAGKRSIPGFEIEEGSKVK